MSEIKTPVFGVTIVSNDLIQDIFPKIKPMLLKGKKWLEDYYTLGDIRKLLIKGDLQLWVAVEGPEVKLIMLTMLATYPRSVWLRLVYVGGEQLDKALYCLSDVEKWAKTHGAVGTEGTGRWGWKRVIKNTRLADAQTGIVFKLKFDESE